MVRVDTTTRTKAVLRHAGVESIDREQLSAVDNAESFERYATHNCTFAAAHRAIAPMRIHYAVRQVQLKRYAATVARCAMRRLNNGGAYLSNWGQRHECLLKVKLRARAPTPARRRGRTLSAGARGA
jgi:hypothetical protein